MSLACKVLSQPAKTDDQDGSLQQVVDRVSRTIVDTQLGHPGPNGLDVTMIAADKPLVPGQSLRPGSQITETRKPSEEPLCLADVKNVPTLASWLQ